jgi:hypothetical protein
MPLTRRSFLRAGSLAALAAAALAPRITAFALEPVPAGLRGRHGIRFDPAGFTRSAFEPYVGGVFRGRAGRRTINLTLRSVEGYEPGAATRIAQARARTTDSFTLTFSSDRPLGTASATHTLEHGALGRFDLFMTGGPDDRSRFIYQAVINRLV